MPRIYVQAIMPRKPFPPNRKAVEDILRQAGHELLDVAIKYHYQIVEPWKGPPDFKGRVDVNLAKAITIYVWAVGENAKKWKWLIEGTRPHIIRSRAKKALAFKTGYQPYTKPGASGQYRGPGKAVGPGVVVAQVRHPGTKKRDFPAVIARWMRQRKDTRNVLKNAIQRAKRVL